ncbi:hypothetical protein GZ77_15800 [Endozoicomonas montiporae]|uniref:N-acetyltransferase domain-containing protein n=2 Tax=Endozoicomonas montiporae TaxID=1027273 RepID=A0A081N5M9_9GAMM|nr:GNAT family protein [Endozoicomonas montiporae]AMO57351.1 N-acetyltransferase GCN5 [Endozoicomonas montiporae CL-33]KEQ13752.1 hypothetical protein GZ77_15800 [Endozoicomonas montiporae]
MTQDFNLNGQPVGQPMPQWKMASLPEALTLNGHYCRLERVNVDQHGKDLYETLYASVDQQEWTYLLHEPAADEKSFMSWLREISQSHDPVFYTIVATDTVKAVGLASYLRINPEHGVIEVGHLHFSPLLQKTAAATEAMYLMMKYAFEQLGYRRYEWKCDSLNAPSRKAALRLGFTFEGIFRQALVYKGRNRDTAWFSMLDGEWPELKKAFEQWLNPDNFNSEGQQLQKLQAARC